jgi:hypothetical protein
MHGDVSLARAWGRTVRGPDARARQINVDLMRRSLFMRSGSSLEMIGLCVAQHQVDRGVCPVII